MNNAIAAVLFTLALAAAGASLVVYASEPGTPTLGAVLMALAGLLCALACVFTQD